MKKCKFCGNSFEPASRSHVFCSNKCKRLKRYNCAYCNKDIVRYKTSAKHVYCSRKCAELHSGRAIRRLCRYCGTDFTVKQSALRYGYGKYCSNECHNRSMEVYNYAICESCNKKFRVNNNNHTGRFCSKQCSHEGFRKPIDEKILEDMYVKREMTAREIGWSIGRSKKVVLDYLKHYGIKVRPDGLNGRKRIKCKDGHLVRSHYERAFDNYLYKEGIPHEYDYRLPFDKRYMADFKVGHVYVEIWGMMGWKQYEEVRERKLNLYKENNCVLLEVFPKDFKELEVKIKELKHLIK